MSNSKLIQALKAKNKTKTFVQGMNEHDDPERINPIVSKELRKNTVDYEKSPKFIKLKKAMGK